MWPIVASRTRGSDRGVLPASKGPPASKRSFGVCDKLECLVVTTLLVLVLLTTCAGRAVATLQSRRYT
jgi:hypothetical protein